MTHGLQLSDCRCCCRAQVWCRSNSFHQVSGITVRIEDFADNKTLDALGIENEWNLSGLYHGSPLDKQSVWSSGDLPPIITLYRMPLLREWHETGVKLEELVRHIVIHEVGHHFGLSDEEMAALERQAG